MNIYVANVPYTVSDQDLRELFEQYGEVSSAKIIMDRETNRSRGFGFVEMANDDQGRQAIEGTNGKPFRGRDLVVNEARPRTPGDRPSFGGGGGGSRGFDRRPGGGDRFDRGRERGGDRGGDDRQRRGEYREDRRRNDFMDDDL
jgi:RNA recognition motif-containing protein